MFPEVYMSQGKKNQGEFKAVHAYLHQYELLIISLNFLNTFSKMSAMTSGWKREKNLITLHYHQSSLK